ncbi:MAG: hypothetical protein ACTSYT_00045 [Candidatus Asgardarchaeia archaeon]
MSGDVKTWAEVVYIFSQIPIIVIVFIFISKYIGEHYFSEYEDLLIALGAILGLILGSLQAFRMAGKL